MSKKTKWISASFKNLENGTIFEWCDNTYVCLRSDILKKGYGIQIRAGKAVKVCEFNPNVTVHFRSSEEPLTWPDLEKDELFMFKGESGLCRKDMTHMGRECYIELYSGNNYTYSGRKTDEVDRVRIERIEDEEDS